MSTHKTSEENLKTAIYKNALSFLKGLDLGYSKAELEDLLLQIKHKEVLLFKQEGTLLSPELWKMLHNRFILKFNVPPDALHPISTSDESSQ